MLQHHNILAAGATQLHSYAGAWERAETYQRLSRETETLGFVPLPQSTRAYVIFALNGKRSGCSIIS